MQIYIRLFVAAMLILLSAALVVKSKKRVYPLSLVLACLGIFVSISTVRNPSALAEKEDNTAGDYLFLAESAMSAESLDQAEEYLKALYSHCGETSEGTLAYARLAILRNDYVGAAVLYGKLDTLGKSEVFDETDKKIYEKLKDGTTTDRITAASIIAQIGMIRESGGDITSYGYSTEQEERLKKIADGSEDLSSILSNNLLEKTKSKKDGNKRFEKLGIGLDLADKIAAEYKAYIKEGNHNADKVKDYVDELDDIYSDDASVFNMSALDEAYVKAKIMNGDRKDLAAYAAKTGSQLGLVSVAQLVIDGKIKEKDLPEGFISISKEEQKAVASQCKEAVSTIKSDKSLDGAELAEVESKAAAVANMADNLALAELDNRIDPESVPVEEQSPLFLGSSAVSYALGNTEKGDSNFGKSLDTARFFEDAAYTAAFEGINAVVYDVADDSKVKDIGQLVQDAYDAAVPHSSPIVDAEEEKRIEEEAKKAAEEKKDKDKDKDEGSSNFNPYADAGNDEVKANPTAADQLTAQGTTYVTKQKAMLNIGKIDASGFTEVKFNLQTAKPIDLKNPGLIINDCNVVITDYKIEEKKYDSARIYAVCDKSGSMEGSTDRLQAAVWSLANSISKKEEIGVIGFSSDVEFASGLVKKASDLQEYIEKLEAYGGTNIASGTFYALDELAKYDDSINVVIVMTDGEDSTFYDSQLARLSDICNDGHTIVYTVGLGNSVNTEYLRRIASAGNGKFVYSFSASELEALYAFIHSQMENNYVVTFTAKNEKKKARTLTVTSTNDGSTMSKDYYLDGEDEEQDEDLPFTINGFATKKIYRKNADVPVTIKGTGFESDMSCYVSIVGDSYQGSFEGKYTSETTFKLTIPAKVPAGKYKATISIDEGSLEEEIEILDGDEKTFTFGAYTFVGEKVERNEDNTEVAIKGNVVLNGFLHFKSDVYIKGEIDKNTSVTMSSYGGSYIAFSKPQKGLMALFGSSVALGNWSDYTLYNDENHMDDLDNYKVETLQAHIPVIITSLSVSNPELKLYPHKVDYKVTEITFNFPFISQVFESAGGELPFKFAAKAGGFVDGTGHYAIGNVALEDVSKKCSIKAIKLGIKKLAFDWNTYKDDYSAAFIVSTNLINADDGSNYGFEAAWKGGLWDSLKIYADIPVPLVEAPVPVSLSNFFIGFEDMSKVPQGSGFGTTLLNTTWEGGCDIGVAKVSDLIPAAGAIFGDLSLVTFADTTAKLNIGKLSYDVSSNVKLFGEIDCGRLNYKLGGYDYDSYILGVKEKEVFGILMTMAVGPDINLARMKVKCQGSGTLALNNYNCCLSETGTFEYDIDIIKRFTGNLTGTYEWGIYDDGGKPSLYIALKGNSGGSDEGFMIGFSGWTPFAKLY